MRRKPRVAPLRSFGAPVGMTILLQGRVGLDEAAAVKTDAVTTELSSRPERSVVRDPRFLLLDILVYPLRVHQNLFLLDKTVA